MESGSEGTRQRNEQTFSRFTKSLQSVNTLLSCTKSSERACACACAGSACVVCNVTYGYGVEMLKLLKEGSASVL